MNVTKFIITIICSVWFIPVSCTVGLYAGTHYFSWSDIREIDKGDQLHPLAHFVYEEKSGDDNKSFKSSLFKDLHQTKISSPGLSFLMEPENDSIKSGKYNSITYKVVSKVGADQILEVMHNDDDKTIWTTYKATTTDIRPISSKMMYFGYLFKAIPYALIFALLHLFGGRLIRKKSSLFKMA
jgi:hypothetical protein